ncbi:ribonuclease H-like protein [Trametopsis cervina]|nr:ribonuclease H-like protein [Trametopsis cervina]
MLFDPSVTTKGALAEGFRIFTNPAVASCEPAHRQPRGATVEDEATALYTDGSCHHNGDADARAGSGVWYGLDDERNIAKRVPGAAQSNQTGEIYAIILAVAATPPLHKWRDQGWIGIANAELFQMAAYQLQQRSAVTTFEWIQGHTGDTGNEGADELADQGAHLPDDDTTTFDVPAKWNLTGAKLATMSQALAYQGIRTRKRKPDRPASRAPLDMARHCIRDHLSGRMPTDATIWHSLRHKDISKNISDFLWRTMHNSQRVGKYWRHIPSLEPRAICPLCDEEESMQHILTECESPAKQLVWRLAESAWMRKHHAWPPLHLGNILGAALADFSDNNGKRAPGASRFFRILVTESAHLVWKLRCERRIHHDDDPTKKHTDREVEARWRTALNIRLRLDCEMTKAKYGKRALSRDVVLRTWSGLLKDEDQLPADWTETGFLVGMGPL